MARTMMCLSIPNLDAFTLSKGEHFGFEWQTVHNGRQFRCGYIRVGPEHPWFEKSYDGIDVDVHGGGLTFSRHGVECPTHGPEAEWWIGFDCQHEDDAPDPTLPMPHEIPQAVRDIYKSMYDGCIVRSTAYVEAECRSLCEQAAEASAQSR